MTDEIPDQSSDRQQAGDPAGGHLADSYRERLWVPVGWWVLASLFALSMFVAVIAYLGLLAAVITFVALEAIIAAAYISYGRTTVRVTADRLWVGPANIEWRYVKAVKALDAPESRQRRGPRSDARAFIMLRPYLSRTVEITINDRDDPTPYWLVASRHPERFATAVAAHIGRSRKPSER